MKQKTQKLVFEGIGYTTSKGADLWVEIPISLMEGYIFDAAIERRKRNAEPESDPLSRKANARSLDLVTEWNFDDAKGKPLPLIGTIKIEDFTDDGEDVPEDDRKTALDKWHDARGALVAQCPVLVFGRIMQRIFATDTEGPALTPEIAEN